MKINLNTVAAVACTAIVVAGAAYEYHSKKKFQQFIESAHKHVADKVEESNNLMKNLIKK